MQAGKEAKNTIALALNLLEARDGPRPITRSRRLNRTDARVTTFLQHPQNVQIVSLSVKRLR